MNFVLLIAGLWFAGCGGEAFEVRLDVDAQVPSADVQAPDVDVQAPSVDLQAPDVVSDVDAQSVRVVDDGAQAVEATIEATATCTPFASDLGQPPCLSCGGCAPQSVPMFYWVINTNGCGGGYTPKLCTDCREHYTCDCLRANETPGSIAADAGCELDDGGILVVWQ